MKPIFHVNLCKLTDKLFAEFENATIINAFANSSLTIQVKSKDTMLANINLYETEYLDDLSPSTTFNAVKEGNKITYLVNGFEAISGLELEKSMKKLRAIVHCCQKGGKVLLNIDDKLLETLKVLDSVF